MSESISPPRPVENAQLRQFDVTGYLSPWFNGEPSVVTLPGTDDIALMVFSTLEKLQQMINEISLPMDSIKQIDSPIEFFESLPTHVAPDRRLRIILDPALTPDGNTRFSEIIRGG